MANLQRLTNLSRSQEHRIHELEAIIRAIERSLSWRGTKSLRQTAAKLRELFRGEVAD